MNEFFNVFVYGLIAGLATIAGIYLVLAREPWARQNSIYLITFSAGVLLATAIGHLLPEAQVLQPGALIWFLVSFIVFYIIEHGLILHACHEGESCEVHPIDRIALAGMGLHSLLDGIIIGVGFEISASLGVIATLSVLLHRLPDGIAITSVLLHSDYPKQKTIIYTWIIALLAPVGAIGAFLFLQNVRTDVLGILVALAAGSFLYVAASDLVPEIHKKGKFLNIILIILGVLFPFVIKMLLG